jgi:hypothetical protein
MLKSSQFWLITALALAAALFAGVNMVLFRGARAMQIEVQGQQQFIQQTVTLEALHREMIRVLAELSVRSQDSELREMLAGQGVRIGTPPGQAAGSATPPAQRGTK